MSSPRSAKAPGTRPEPPHPPEQTGAAAATVEVPEDGTWLPTPAGQVFCDAVIRHPGTGDAVRVVAFVDTTIVDPDGHGSWWQRGRVPARAFTLAPDRMSAEKVVLTVARSAVLDRLDRPYADLPAPPPPAPHPPAPHQPRRRGDAGEPRRRGRPGPAWDETARRERLEAFHDTLSQQVLTLTSSRGWTDWLRTASRFHQYSFGNTVAIWMQAPDATQVAGYRAWQSLGRQVRKGEQAIQILAPVTRRRTDQPDEPDEPEPPGPRPKSDPATGRGETGAGPAVSRRVVGVRIASVFDISQTDGDPLPGTGAAHPALLTGHAPQGLWDGLALQVAEAGFRLTLETPRGGANGLTSWWDRRVLVRPELEDAQRVKTLAHELGHVELHQPDDVTNPTAQACRGQKEVEAESVAFLVTTAHGMDTGQYSFPYVAGWAQHHGGDIEATLRQSAGRALSTAHRILDRLDRDNPDHAAVAEDAAPAHLHPPRPAGPVARVEAEHAQARVQVRQPGAVGVGR